MPSTTSVRVRKPGCIPCRERHLRCDHAPRCSNCRKARRKQKCEYPTPSLKIRQVAFSSPEPSLDDDTAVPTDPDFNNNVSVDVDGDIVESPGPAPHTLSEAIPTFSPLAPRENGSSADFHLINTPVAVAPISPTAVSPASFRASAPTIFTPQAWHEFDESVVQMPRITNGFTRMVISSGVDARVFGFFISHMGKWLDIVSPSRYFGVTIPRLALSNRALYYACLTCASRVLIRQGTLDKTKCDEYEDTAISAFIPQLSNLGHAHERETLPAIATILRMAEQFYEIQEDTRCHLAGAPSLFTGKPDGFGHGSAAFWLYLRQSIRAAFLNEEPCKLDPKLVPVDFNPVSEAAWSNRMAVLLARTCSACWASSLESTQQEVELDELRILLELWRQNVPETFLPWCNYRAENEPFPVIRYISPWHVVAWQFYYAAKILIGSHRTPRNVNMIGMSRYMEVNLTTLLSRDIAFV
ncbi:hypothetical protein LTS17_009514 [Exophiala oligosperma]